MARIDCSGAEVGSVIELDSVTTTLVVGAFSSSTTRARSGSRSWKGQVTGATDPPGAAVSQESGKGRMDVSPARTTFSVRFSFYVASADVAAAGESVSIFSLNDGVLNKYIVPTFDPGGISFALVDSALTGPYAYDTWHNVSIRCVLNIALPGNLDTFVIRIDKDTVTQVADTFDSGISFIEFGIVQARTAANASVYIDDIVTDSANIDIGDEFQLYYFKPSATDTAGLTLVGAATHHAAVTDQSDTSTVGITPANTANLVDIFSATDPRPSISAPGGVLNVACVYGSVRNGAATDSLLGTTNVFLWILSGVNSAFARPAPALLATTHRSTLVSTARPGGGAWQSADLAILKPTVGKEASALAESYTFEEVWLYAEALISVTVNDTSPAISETSTPVIYSEGTGGGAGLISIINE